jgi:nitrogen fixation protein FixH
MIESPPPGLQGWDIIFVVMFFAVVIAIGIYVSIFRSYKNQFIGLLGL